MTRKEKAVQLFKEGYNCAQSVFGAYADLYEIPGGYGIQDIGIIWRRSRQNA